MLDTTQFHCFLSTREYSDLPATSIHPSARASTDSSAGYPCCADVITGWKAWNHCLQYYNCENEHFVILYATSVGTIYDEDV